MILPINNNPSVNTYMHHACIHAILESKELLRLSVADSKKENWIESVNDTEICWNEDNLIINEKNYGANTESCILRDCKENDELLINIQYKKNKDFNINLLISNKNAIENSHTNKGVYTFGLCKYGLFFVNKFIPNDDIKVSKCAWLKLVRKGRRVSSYVSDNGNQWEMVDESELDYEIINNQVKIGLLTDFGKNDYYNWKFMNFIQLFYNPNDKSGKVWLDYYITPRKNIDYAFQCASQFLNTEYCKFDEIIDLYGDVHSFIQWSLNHCYYVSIRLDEYYIERRRAYEYSHYPHYNLIYGYDYESKKYYALGYGDKISDTEILYDVMDKAIILKSDILRYRIDVNTEGLPFDINKLRNSIKEYIDGANTNKSLCNILVNRSGKYGLNILDELIYTDKGNELLVNDRRIAYILFEHCKIMKDRLIFLSDNNFLDEEIKQDLIQRCEDMMDEADLLKNLIMKSKFKQNMKSSIIKSAINLFEIEKNFYRKFIAKYINTL